MDKSRVGLISLTSDKYIEGPNSLLPEFKKFSSELTDSLAEITEIIHLPAAYNKETIARAIIEFGKEKVHGIIIICLSYLPPGEAFSVLKKTKIPLLLLSTQNLKTIDNKYTSRLMLENHGIQGIQDLANLLLRNNTGFHIINGHFKDNAAILKIEDWCKTVKASASLNSARIGRIGHRFSKIGDFSTDTKILKETMGTTVIEIETPKLKDLVSHTEVKRVESKKYLPQNIIWAEDIEKSLKEESIKAASFLKNIKEENELSALAINFRDIGWDMPVPFLAISYLLSEGIGYSNEGNVFTAASVLLGQLLSDKQATFIEMYTVDYDNSLVLLSNSGEFNMRLRRTTDPIKLVLDTTRPGNGIKTVIPVFTVQPGPYTLFNLTSTQNSDMSIIASNVQVVDNAPLTGLSTPHCLIRPKEDINTFLTAYSMAGGTRRMVMASGNITNKLSLLCKIKKLKYTEI